MCDSVYFTSSATPSPFYHSTFWDIGDGTTSNLLNFGHTYNRSGIYRIQNKVYGVCRVSGKLISKGRLKAVPHATLSIHAKQAR